jgi:hypothetical protein
MRGAKPVVVTPVQVDSTESDAFFEGDGVHTVYKWVVPWEAEPTK